MTDNKTHHQEGHLKNTKKAVGTAVNARRDENDGRVVQAEDLRKSPMMAKLWDDLQNKVDIGHFGRLVFTIIARHYLSEDELIRLLANNLEVEDAQVLLLEVNERNYNPPRPSVIRKWQLRQAYRIIPPDQEHNLAWGNVYAELKLPQEIYDQVGGFYKEQAKGLDLPSPGKQTTKKKPRKKH